MLCYIADLLVEVPETGGMSPRCRDYCTKTDSSVDITISEKEYQLSRWPPMPENDVIYLESGLHFYGNLLRFQGMMLHASAIEMDGRAYLFSGPCGAGKSTHTRLWQKVFGNVAQVFNDDKPALRRVDGQWYAYGTPWCGKDGINQNKKVPLGGICFLKKGNINFIRRLPKQEALKHIFAQTTYKLLLLENMDRLLSVVDKLVCEIPVFELTNRPEEAAARLSYETMSRTAKEENL